MKILRANTPLLIIFFVALILRVWGAYPGYPPYHPDEPQIYSRALLILKFQEEKLGYWGYPALIPLIHALFYGLFFIPVTLIYNIILHFNEFRTLEIDKFIQTFVYGVNDINVLYWGRLLSGVLGAVTAAASFVVGKKFFHSIVGWFAGLSVALNYKHVFSSHFALPDVPNGLFLLITIFASLYILEKKTLRTYVLAAISAALSFSVKLSPFAFVSVGLAHLISSRTVFKRIFWTRLIMISSVFVLTVITINFFHVTHLDALFEDIDKLNKRYLAGSIGLLLYPYGYLFISGLGPVLSVLSIIGIIYSLIVYFKRALLLILPLALFFFSLTIYSTGGVYIRNFVGVIPILLIFSGVGMWAITKVFKLRKNLPLPIILFIFLLANLTHTKDLFIVNQSYSTQWNMDRIREHFSQGYENKTITANNWFASYAFPQNIVVKDFSLNLAEAQEEEANFALVDTDSTEYLFTWWMANREVKQFVSPPSDLLLETFAGGSLKQILGRRSHEFIKSYQAPETNFFVVPIPEQKDSNLEREILTEEFNQDPTWRVKGSLGLTIPNIGLATDSICNGCIKIGHILESDINIRYLYSVSTPRFYRFTSSPMEVEDEKLYKVSSDIYATQVIEKNKRDGFFKVELYKNKIEAESERPGDFIFVSARLWGKIQDKKEIEFWVPKGYKYMTISFQRDRNEKIDLYFDNLKVEQLKGMYEEKEAKSFPQELIFVGSIF